MRTPREGGWLLFCIRCTNLKCRRLCSLRRSFEQLYIKLYISLDSRMNLPALSPLSSAEIQKYLPFAVQLTLKGHLSSAPALTKKEKVVVSKLFLNLSKICKLSLKQVKQLVRVQPEYQQALGDLFFDKSINNYFLITNNEKATTIPPSALLERSERDHPLLVVDVQYRIEFTVSTISKKNVMKPVVLLVFTLRNGRKVSLYLSVEQLGALRERAADSMRHIYGVELRAL